MDDRPGPPSCLVLHGLGGGPYELAPLIDALAGAGVRVLAPTLPGHDDPGPKMPHSRWRDWADAAEAAFDTLAVEGRPVAVLGFSTGGTLALRMATRRPVDRLLLLAPFLAIRFSGLVPWRPPTYLRGLARVLPDLPRRPPAVRDPAMRRRVAAEATFRTFSLRSTLSALELIDEVRALVPSIAVPTRIFQGRLDTVVEPRHAAWLDRNLPPAGGGRLVWFDRSDHLLTLDRERERVIAAALEFLTGGPGLSPDRSAGRSP